MTDKTTEIFRSFIVFFVLSVLVFWVDRLGFSKPIWRFSDSLVVPVKTQVYKLRVSMLDAVSVLTFWKSGEERIKFLDQRVLELQAGAVRSRELLEENKVLRDQLEVQKRFGFKMILATVVGYDRYIEIDKGQDAGVIEGMAVVVGDALVGRISRVLPRTSLVVLPVDPGEKLAVSTVGKAGRAKGIAFGDFGTRIILDKVLQKETLSIGDLLVTLGEGGIPKDLLVGTVEKINASEKDVFKKAEVKSAINYGDLEMVFVVKE